MKIAIVSPDDLSILILFKGLINAFKQEKAWEIVTISPGDEYISMVKELGAEHVYVKMDRYLSPINDFKYLISLYNIFREQNFDIIFNFTTKPIIYGTIAARLARNKRIICAFRGLGRVFQAELGLKGKLVKKCVTGLFWIACTLSQKVWFTNKNDLEYFLSKGIVKQDKVFSTNNGINIEYFSSEAVDNTTSQDLKKMLGFDDKNEVVIMVARMIWPKGIKEFIEASEILLEEYPSVKFILVGPLENDSPQHVPESYLKKHENAGNFKWLGFRNDVRELYAISDIAVLPSYYKEGGYPRALLEPMALGKPVITTNMPDCRGPVDEGKNGYLVPVKDAQSLANAIKILLNDAHKRREFGHYSRLKVENEFDEKIIFQRVLKEFHELV